MAKSDFTDRAEVKRTVENALRSIHMGLTNAGAGTNLLPLEEISAEETADGLTIRIFRSAKGTSTRARSKPVPKTAPDDNEPG
jgi:hypothetical protein